MYSETFSKTHFCVYTIGSKINGGVRLLIFQNPRGPYHFLGGPPFINFQKIVLLQQEYINICSLQQSTIIANSTLFRNTRFCIQNTCHFLVGNFSLMNI